VEKELWKWQQNRQLYEKRSKMRGKSNHLKNLIKLERKSKNKWNKIN
jgi:hypothetical protein